MNNLKSLVEIQKDSRIPLKQQLRAVREERYKLMKKCIRDNVTLSSCELINKLDYCEAKISIQIKELKETGINCKVISIERKD